MFIRSTMRSLNKLKWYFREWILFADMVWTRGCWQIAVISISCPAFQCFSAEMIVTSIIPILTCYSQFAFLHYSFCIVAILKLHCWTMLCIKSFCRRSLFNFGIVAYPVSNFTQLLLWQIYRLWNLQSVVSLKYFTFYKMRQRIILLSTCTLRRVVYE